MPEICEKPHGLGKKVPTFGVGPKCDSLSLLFPAVLQLFDLSRRTALGRSELQTLNLGVLGPGTSRGRRISERRTGSLRPGQKRSCSTAIRLLALAVASESGRNLAEHVRVAPSRGIADFALCPDPGPYCSLRVRLWAKTM